MHNEHSEAVWEFSPAPTRCCTRGESHHQNAGKATTSSSLGATSSESPLWLLLRGKAALASVAAMVLLTCLRHSLPVQQLLQHLCLLGIKIKSLLLPIQPAHSLFFPYHSQDPRNPVGCIPLSFHTGLEHQGPGWWWLQLCISYQSLCVLLVQQEGSGIWFPHKNKSSKKQTPNFCWNASSLSSSVIKI